MKAYRTLLTDASEEYVIQKSRFIGRAAPVASEEAALALLESVRREHNTASHHCYAYIIGANAGIMRYSDDGEPGGTAGMPILEVLRVRALVDCAVVITRYFGGILLGAGGLTRAYSHTCALALAASGEGEMSPSESWRLEVAYPLWDRVQHALKSLPVQQGEPEFTDTVCFPLLCRQADTQRVMEELTRVTGGRIRCLSKEELYYAWASMPGLEAKTNGSV